MNSDNLIFSSKIDPQVEDVCFDLLTDYFEDEDFDKVYVEPVGQFGEYCHLNNVKYSNTERQMPLHLIPFSDVFLTNIFSLIFRVCVVRVLSFHNPAEMYLAPFLSVWEYLLPLVFNFMPLKDILRKQKNLILFLVIAIC